MRINLLNVSVRDLTQAYRDDGEGGVVGYGGALDIRPQYQREFIYNEKQRAAVINTVQRGFPLNVMYWAVRNDGTYEVIDGQQRTISICQYVHGDFSFEGLYFHNLPEDKKKSILDYELTVYECSGTESEKLDWFRTINIAGVELTDQELRNAVYAGPWVSDAKRYFSRRNCPAYAIGSDYVGGSAARQDYLERVIDWVSGGQVEDYMGRHQHDTSAEPLWEYFQEVIEWVRATFTKPRPPMKSVNWGSLYRDYKDASADASFLDAEVTRLILDDDVTRKPGIYPYVLDGDERHLNIRAFTQGMKLKVHVRQKGVCPLCSETFELAKMEADHITPWVEGGKTTEENCQLLCRDCNRRKGAK